MEEKRDSARRSGSASEGPQLPRARLLLESEELLETPEGFVRGELAVYSARSPVKLGANEDGALLLSADGRRAVLAVADGVGGQPSASRASRIALRELTRSLADACAARGPLREAILAGLERANGIVVGEGLGSATTLALVELDGNSVRAYHVGDSGVIAFDEDGRIRLQTIAHSPVGYAVEAGFLDEHDAIEHQQRHLVSNVIGDPAMHVCMSSPIQLDPGDTVLVATDGLFDNFHTLEIVARLRRAPLADAVRELARECRARMLSPASGRPSKADDLTLIALRAPLS